MICNRIDLPVNILAPAIVSLSHKFLRQLAMQYQTFSRCSNAFGGEVKRRVGRSYCSMD